MSDEGLLRRLLREHADAVSTEIAIIKEDAIVRLFDAVQSEHDPQVAALIARAKKAEARAEAAEAALRWIPIGERLPDFDTHIEIASVALGLVSHGCLHSDHGKKYWDDFFTGDEYGFNVITHWKPLPEPPKGGEE